MTTLTAKDKLGLVEATTAWQCALAYAALYLDIPP